MGIFNNEEKKEKKVYKPHAPKDPEKKQERLEKKEAWEAFKKQMKDNPELEREFVFKKMGITAPKPQDPTEKQRIELKSALMAEATEMIKNDPELRRQYAESMIGDVLGKGHTLRPGRHGDEDDYSMMPPGSSIGQALEELESLGELKDKLAALGMGGGDSKKSGFFEGITLKDVLGVVMMLKGGGMGGNGDNGGNGKPQAENYYVVDINGKPTRIGEAQYNRMVTEGRIKPMAQIEAPKKVEEPVSEDKEESEEPAIQPLISGATSKPATDTSIGGFDLPPLDTILEYASIETIEGYIYKDPTELVSTLKIEVDEGSETAQFIWGLLTNINYEGLMNLVSKYKGDERVTTIIDKLESEDGKKWINDVLAKVQEMKDA